MWNWSTPSNRRQYWFHVVRKGKCGRKPRVGFWIFETFTVLDFSYKWQPWEISSRAMPSPTKPGREKTYTCAECAKTFTGNLKKHVLTHFGDKPHKCADFGKAFAQGNHLKRHKLTHSGERRHNCDKCSGLYPEEVHVVDSCSEFKQTIQMLTM